MNDSRLRAYLAELPNALFLGFITAAVTLILAIVLSVLLGGENVAHREASRCQAAYIVEVLEQFAEYHGIDPADIDRINIEGLDCSEYIYDEFDHAP